MIAVFFVLPLYDTIHFLINRLDVPHENIFDSITPYLSNVKVISSKNGQSIIGNIENMGVFINERGIKIQGSICKYYFGDNLQELQRKDVAKSIEKLSDNLHIDISNAKVTRLDISANLIVKNIPNTYFKYLGNMPRLIRLLTTPDTLYYKSSKKTLMFYDNVKEAQKNRVVLPDVFQGSNILRYEARYLKEVDKQTNNSVTASLLYNTDFYRAIIEKWHNNFKSISKVNRNSTIMIDNINTIKEAEIELLTYLLQQQEPSIIDEFISQLKSQKAFKERANYSKLKKA